jgi:hypothetical protein
MDGASGWQSFRSITWPSVRPTVLAVAILGVIFTFKLFDLDHHDEGRAGQLDRCPADPRLPAGLRPVRVQEGRRDLNTIFLVLFVLSIGYLRPAPRGGGRMSGRRSGPAWSQPSVSRCCLSSCSRSSGWRSARSRRC